MGRPLLELAPAWVYRAGPHVDAGLSFAGPRCVALLNGREHRLQLWFVSRERSTDKTLGRAVHRLYDFAGRLFDELTVWKELPYPRDSLLEAEHWAGYIEAGHVYDALSFGGP